MGNLANMGFSHPILFRGVHGGVAKVVDFKPLAPHRCGFESYQRLWILSS
jgi:hypothetical protein